MMQFIPITLLGSTLGERHRYLNSLLKDAYKSLIPFKSIQDVPEASPVDRLFKIDLASKHRDVDYMKSTAFYLELTTYIMMQFIPITLSGNTLGERHRHLNSLVNDAYKSSMPFKSIQDVPEPSPVDRLFKIDLASRHRDVDYIIQNVKDSDLLYVSRALKCTWLLDPEYNHIINPDFLEDEVFPEMITSAINKMKHWMEHHIQNPERCRIFYKYYKKNEFEFAIKFLRHCSNEYLLKEFENIMTRIKPKQLKVLSEKCPQLTKMFYKRLKFNEYLIKHYLDHEADFLHNLKYLLKSDPDTFFDIVEKYNNVQRNGSFSSDITKYIMLRYRDNFFKKPELYTVHLLNLNTLAMCLCPEEAKDLVEKLAHAEYLESWFTYKTVEPLILRLDKDSRIALKKKIFVTRDLGDKITKWPYTLPTSPLLERKPGYCLFLDKVHNPHDYNIPNNFYCKKKRKMKILRERFLKLNDCRNRKNTLLDELFDHYRFVSFERTFFQLRTRLRTESSPQNRQFIMLVLVSKCGGRENSVRTLFGLLAEYKNEPVHLRAAVVRSLVKRAFVWRLPEDLWSNLLEWAHGLGLDGNQPEAACNEGLHAVVLRDLLANNTSKPSLLSSFFNLFSNFTEYTLTTAERCYVRTNLPKVLIAAAYKVTGAEKLNRFNQILDTLQSYKIPFKAVPHVITAIATAAQDDSESYRHLLHRLFIARAGRRQLFNINFSRIQNNASYMNALLHDTTVLDANTFKNLHVDKNENKPRLQFDQFLRKLIIYFSEDGGLAKEFYAVLKFEAEMKPHKILARSLALLAGNDLVTLLKTFDCDTKRRPKSERQSLAAALRANVHVSRPPLDLNVFGWEAAGVKAVANVVSICRKHIREEMITKLTTWERAQRLALSLTDNEDTKCAIFKTLVASRPVVALKTFLRYLNHGKFGDRFPAIWNEVKPLITKLDYKNRERLRTNLDNVSIPKAIESEYYTLVYKVYMNEDEREALPVLCKIENICFEVDETFLYDVLRSFLDNDFIPEKVSVDDYDICHATKCSLHIRIIAKFLLLCSSEEIQRKRLEVVGEPFLARFENMWRDPLKRRHLDRFLFEFLTTLKFNAVIFNVKYVSCMPVYKRILSWMQSLLPIEEWFDGYVDIHLTMIYHKAARYCIEHKSEYFNTDTNLDKGVEMFGAIFGKLVAHEYEVLKLKYFQSIREIYKKELIDYFVKSLDYESYDDSKEKFAIAFIKSVLGEKKTKEAHLLAFHVFQEHVMYYFNYDSDLSHIMNILKDTNDNELRFNFEIMMSDDTERCNKIKRFLM